MPGLHSIFNLILLQYGKYTYKLFRYWTHNNLKLVKWKEHLFFNHRCQEMKLIPPSLFVKPLVNNSEGKRIAERTSFSFLKARISECHMIILKLNKELKSIIRTITHWISPFHLHIILKYFTVFDSLHYLCFSTFFPYYFHDYINLSMIQFIIILNCLTYLLVMLKIPSL